MGLLRNLEIMLGGVVTSKVSGKLYDWMEAVSQLLDGEGGPAGGVGVGASFGLTQTAWFVDPVNGNDANNGSTAALALKTDAHRQVLWGGADRTYVNLPTTVTYLGNLPASDVINVNALVGPAGTLLLQGTVTAAAVVGSGAFTAVQAINRAGNLVSNVTDGARAWTVGQRIRITGGARVGAVAWVTKDLGAGVAETTAFVTLPAQPATTTPTLVTVQIGDPYVCETMSTASLGCCIFNTSGPFVANLSLAGFSQISLSGSAGGAQGLIDSMSGIYAGNNCVLSNLRLQGSSSACFHWTCLNTLNTVSSGHVRFFAGGSAAGTQTTIAAGAEAGFDGDYLAADCSIAVTSNSGGACSVTIGTAAAMRATGAAVQLNSGGTAKQLTLSGGANALYGSGNVNGVISRSNANYNYTTKPTIATTGSDAVVGGTNKTWAAIPYVEPANNASVVAFA